MLQSAAILHEVGTYISGRAFHKHAYYIISHSEVFGLNQSQLELVAQIARYHRRSRPKQSHLEYMKLSRPDRIIVSKLGSILRVADALDTSRTQQIKDFKCSFDQDSLNIEVETGSDMTLTRRALQTKSDMFKDTYGLRVNLEEK
jgi:exopolyphosphatase/guanosine-5'-triphosphate,3'-diphosphate pyrophosphatase